MLEPLAHDLSGPDLRAIVGEVLPPETRRPRPRRHGARCAACADADAFAHARWVGRVLAALLLLALAAGAGALIAALVVWPLLKVALRLAMGLS